MTIKEADKLIACIQDMARAEVPTTSSRTTDDPGPFGTYSPLSALDSEALYQMFRARFIDEARTDPVLLKLLVAQNEIVVEFEPSVIELDGSTMKGRVARLIAAGWFSTTRTTGGVRKELARTGADPGGGGTLSDNLSALLRDGFLVRDGDGWLQAAGVKVTQRALETGA